MKIIKSCKLDLMCENCTNCQRCLRRARRKKVEFVSKSVIVGALMMLFMVTTFIVSSMVVNAGKADTQVNGTQPFVAEEGCNIPEDEEQIFVDLYTEPEEKPSPIINTDKEDEEQTPEQPKENIDQDKEQEEQIQGQEVKEEETGSETDKENNAETLNTVPPVQEETVTSEDTQENTFTPESTAESENAEETEKPKANPTSKISAYGPGDEYLYTFTEEEKFEILQVMYKECGGEPYKGKVAVAAVILNRWASDSRDFDYETMHDLLYDKYQFANGKNVTQEMLDGIPDLAIALDEALRGYDPTREVFENGALYFYNPKYCSESARKAREGLEVMIIGNHYFHDEL